MKLSTKIADNSSENSTLDGDDQFKHQLLATLLKLRDGHFDTRLSSRWSGVAARRAQTHNHN
jgi:hypothetical protein